MSLYKDIVDLYPMCRSITGKGIENTLKYIKNRIPINITYTPTGTEAFDWRVPKEWNIKDAFIQHESGKKFAEFKKINLHIVGYSTPINKWLNKKKLLNYIYTQKDQPNSIPYVTSYYKKRWGFCLSEKEKKNSKCYFVSLHNFLKY